MDDLIERRVADAATGRSAARRAARPATGAGSRVHEVMLVTEEIERLIIERRSTEDIKKVGRWQGMITLREDGLRKVGHGPDHPRRDLPGRRLTGGYPPDVGHRPLTILGLMVLLMAGCSSGKGPTGRRQRRPPPRAQVATPPNVTVTAREYGFDVPAEIEGGVVRLTLRNDGRLKHEAVIVAAGDTPLARLKEDLTPIVQGTDHATPGYVRFQGGVSLVPGRHLGARRPSPFRPGST